MSKRDVLKHRKPIIAVHHLYVIYNRGLSNEVRALKDISFDVYPGEFIIFFGPSGCGKSTLLYSISGLETNVEGSVRVHGTELTSLGTGDLAHFHQTVIGMIFQAYYLISSLTVLENVALPQMALRRPRREREKRANLLLQHFGVSEQARKLPTELSGGQQQRVAICRALMNEPDIIVADEPVGNLDTKASGDVMNLLRSLNDEQKKTIILVTHDPSHLHHAHRIIYLRDGTIAGIKENTTEERRESAVKKLAQASVPLALRHWAQTVTVDMLQSTPSAYMAVKAQEIVAEVLTGMTLEELRRIDEVIVRLLQGTSKGMQEIYETLHGALEKHGLSIEKRRALRLAHKISRMVEEVAAVQSIKRKATTRRRAAVATEAARIRSLALVDVGGVIPQKSIRIVDRCIIQRMRGEIDFQRLTTFLDLPIRKGGAGLDRRFARRLARAIEPLASTVQSILKTSNETSSPSTS